MNTKICFENIACTCIIQESGHAIELNDGTYINLHGAVLCSLGDIPASNFMGGFKEGVGFALRKCRACLTTKEEMQAKVQ